MGTFFRAYLYLLDRAWFQRRTGFLDRLDLVSCFDDLSAPHRIGSRPVRNEKNQYDCFLRCRSDRPGVRVLPQLYYNRSFLCDHDGPAQQHQSDRREAGNDLAVSVRKDPDLGTIGYALGTQAAGYLYDAISPSAIFIAFVVSILICIIGTLRIDVDPVEAEEIKEKDQMTGKEEKTGFRSLLANRKYVYYLVVYALFTGVTQATHTFVPSMFTYEGLPASAASTILSIAVLCELPLVFFSGKFMDRCTSKKLSLIAFSLAMIQLLIYGLNMPMAAKIGITLMAKHPAGMLVIMINLKIVSSLVSPKQQISALALAATVKNLASIVFNNLAGTMIDMEGYALTFLILAGILAVGMLLLVVFRLPEGTDQHLFS